MDRNKGIELVKKYDHVKPMNDLSRWLEYVKMTKTNLTDMQIL